jgi:putative membrane protein
VTSLTSPLARVRAHRLTIGVLLLPVLIGSLVVWSLADRAEQTTQVPAAVVNLDEPVLEKGEPPVAAGRLLAAGLTSPRTEATPTFGWTLTDTQDARSGLADGSYYAVITIPPGFSRTLSDTLKGKEPRQATIGVTSTDETSALVGEVSDQVARVSADRLGERVTTTYLDQVFSRTGDLAGKLGDAADGAERLASGTERLGAGAGELAEGVGRLAGGADRLAGGADRLSEGGTRLSGGARRLADGTQRLAGGADRLASGLGTLERRTDPLPAQTDRLADGARELSDGVVPYTRLLRGWSDACADPLIAARAARLCLVTERAVGAGDRNAERLAEGSRRLAAGTRQLADGVPELTRALDRAASGGRRVASGADRLAAGTTDLAAGAERLASGSQRLAAGAGRLADGARRASTGADRLADGTGRLGDGSTKLADGLDRGAEAIPAYDAGESKDLADVIAAPVAARSDGDGRTPDGATQLAPAAIAFALWLGAFATYLVRPALPDRLLGRASSASRLAAAGLSPGLLVGAGQALLLYVVLRALGADLGSPPAVLGVMLVAAASFAAIHQAFVALLGRRRGWIGAIGFATVQAVSLGGVIPLDTAPGPLQALNGLLPMTRAADGLAATALDGPGSAVLAVVVMLLWGGSAFLLTTRAAARAQQVDLSDLGVNGRLSGTV